MEKTCAETAMNTLQTSRKSSHCQPASQVLNGCDCLPPVPPKVLIPMALTAAVFLPGGFAHFSFVSAMRHARRTRAPHTASR